MNSLSIYNYTTSNLSRRTILDLIDRHYMYLDLIDRNYSDLITALRIVSNIFGQIYLTFKTFSCNNKIFHAFSGTHIWGNYKQTSTFPKVLFGFP